MSVSLQIDVSGDAKVLALLSRLRSDLTDRTPLHKSIGSYAALVTRDHLIAQAGTRHETANRLGASPSGHLARAAESVSVGITGLQDAATVFVTSPGIRRAFGDITITPGAGKKYLTIPATAEAYNRRAGTFNDLRLAFFKSGLLALVKADQSRLSDRATSGYGVESKAARGARAPLAAAARPPVYYWLKKSVSQKQDRTLLPSDAVYAQAATVGIADYLSMLKAAASEA